MDFSDEIESSKKKVEDMEGLVQEACEGEATAITKVKELNEQGKETGRLALEAKKEMVDMQRLVDFIENDIAKNSRVREFKEQQRLAKEAATEAKAALMEQQKSLKEAAAAERKFIQEEKERETLALKTMMEKAK